MSANVAICLTHEQPGTTVTLFCDRFWAVLGFAGRLRGWCEPTNSTCGLSLDAFEYTFGYCLRVHSL